MRQTKRDRMDLPQQMAHILQSRLVKQVENGTVLLRDRQSNMTFEVTGMPHSAETVRIEKLGHLAGLADGGNLKRVCDYALFARSDSRANVDIVLLEMKKTIGNMPDGKEQLRRSKPILDYLLGVCAV